MMRIVLVVVLGLLMHSAQQFAPAAGVGSAPAATTLACGYLLLTAFLVGSLFKSVGLPKLTGYLAAGVVAGPQVLGLVDDQMVGNLRIFNGVAIALIALTAGTEMHFKTMRPLLRSIGWLAVWCGVGTALVLSLTAFLARDLLPFMSGLSMAETLAVSAVLGVTMTAKSPAVVVALKDETDADGPLTRTVMGAVVVADLVVIVLFAAVSSLAQGMFGAQTDMIATAERLSWQLFGSMGVGVAVGLLVVVYMRRIPTSGALFLVALAFVVAEVGQRMNLDPLIIALSAGLLIRNTSEVGQRLRHEVEHASLPVYVAFFAVAGATIHLSVLASLGLVAALFVGVRACSFLVGSRMAAHQTDAPPVVARWLGFGLMPQAGLALALALLFTKTFPQFGASASALVFGVVALNELVAPILFRVALLRSGEAGQGARTRAAAPSSAAAAEPTG